MSKKYSAPCKILQCGALRKTYDCAAYFLALFPILVDNILRTQVVEGVTLLSFFAKLSFSRKKNPSETSSTGVLQSFFQKRRSSRDSGAARQSAFFAKLSFSRKKAERGECRRHSFRSLAAYCSSSAHPRNICCVGFARM